MVREELLVGPAAAASFVPLYDGSPGPEGGCGACERRIAQLLPFDVVVLGMGDDGHIASLFPGAPGLVAALDPTGERFCGPARAPATGSPRLSLLAPALFLAQRVYLLIASAEKRVVYRRALAGADPNELPVAALLEHATKRLEVYWAP
jgi:6-phosphogluconolactonase